VTPSCNTFYAVDATQQQLSSEGGDARILLHGIKDVKREIKVIIYTLTPNKSCRKINRIFHEWFTYIGM